MIAPQSLGILEALAICVPALWCPIRNRLHPTGGAYNGRSRWRLSGFNDLVGKQQTFSEFLRDSLQQPPGVLPPDQQQSWQSLAQKYSDYGDLGFAQRQHLVAETRRFLYGTQRMLEQFSKTKAQRGQTVGELGALARGLPVGDHPHRQLL